VIAVNSAAFLAWWADWWHSNEVAKWLGWLEIAPRFHGIRTINCARGLIEHEYYAPILTAGVQHVDLGFKTISGTSAVHLAARAGAARVALLGFDGRHGAGGVSHWHDFHRADSGMGKSWTGYLALDACPARSTS
jgi:hypothetical protein